jgi:hypothetical protein
MQTNDYDLLTVDFFQPANGFIAIPVRYADSSGSVDGMIITVVHRIGTYRIHLKSAFADCPHHVIKRFYGQIG